MRQAETLRFAATLVCASCHAFANPAESYDFIRPIERPHALSCCSSHSRYWHRGRDGDQYVTWPWGAWQIWEHLAWLAELKAARVRSK